jgi:hypothetical protein
MTTKYIQCAVINSFNGIDETITNIHIYNLCMYYSFFNKNLPTHIQNISIQKITHYKVLNGIGLIETNTIDSGVDINYFFPKIPFGCNIFYTR